MVIERPRIRVLFGSHSFSTPVTIGGSVWDHALAASSNLKETVQSLLSRFLADKGMYLIKRGKCKQSIVWLCSIHVMS